MNKQSLGKVKNKSPREVNDELPVEVINESRGEVNEIPGDVKDKLPTAVKNKSLKPQSSSHRAAKFSLNSSNSSSS